MPTIVDQQLRQWAMRHAIDYLAGSGRSMDDDTLIKTAEKIHTFIKGE